MSDKEALARVKIDKLLEESGWRLLDDNQKRKNVVLEQGYRYDKKTKFTDYLLLDAYSRPLAVIEAKKKDYPLRSAKAQAMEYATRLGVRYDTIAEIEEKVEDAKLRRKSVEAEFITMENIYKILQHFGELYDIISDEEKKELIATLVKEIQIYPEEESDTPLKSMKFNFPVYKDGQEVNEIFLDKQTNVETLVYLGK